MLWRFRHTVHATSPPIWTEKPVTPRAALARLVGVRRNYGRSDTQLISAPGCNKAFSVTSRTRHARPKHGSLMPPNQRWSSWASKTLTSQTPARKLTGSR